ncbi:MAG: hypothetical protein H6748_05430 [Spirochaetaceae bacterium]|nr:hypothetical protein [Myxococcales bacterium]MCB9723471.1 hypothetical protein [Spirochaetaceae bacterium]
MTDTDFTTRHRQLLRSLRSARLVGLAPALIVLVLEFALWGRMTGAAWAVLVVSVVMALGLAQLAAGVLLDRELRPLGSVLRRVATGGDSESGAREALARVLGLPGRVQRVVLQTAPIAVVVPLLVLHGTGVAEAESVARLLGIALVAGAGAMIGALLAYHRVRRGLIVLTEVLSAGGGHLDAEPASNRLAQRIRLEVVAPAVVSMLFVAHAAREGAFERDEARAIRWAGRALEYVAAEDPQAPLASRVAAGLPDPSLWPVRVAFEELNAGRGYVRAEDPLSHDLSEIFDRRLARAEREGRASVRLPGELVAFRRVDDETVLIARLPHRGEGALRADVLPDPRSIAAIVLLIGGVVLLGRTTSREIGDDLGSVRRTLEEIAAGNLRVAPVVRSDDEIGAISAALGSLAAAEKQRLARLMDSLEAAKRSRDELQAVLARAAQLQADRRQRMRTASERFAALAPELDEGTRSLATLVEGFAHSSDAVLELGAGGREIDEAAAVLTTQVEAVSDALEQAVRGVARVGATSERLVSASEETSSSMEEMASAMRAIDSSAEAMAHLSREVIETAELGQAKVAQTIAGTEAIRVATDAAERVIRGLGARTSEIGGILDVIDDVADETNLLALNAAIIAAQAGEQGRAFSVVADEIKELADRVLASTKEIGGLIRSVQEESENAIGAIAAGSESVQSGIALSAEAGRTLAGITEASRESGLRIDSIVNSVREQTGAAGHVVALMERVREAAEELAAVGAHHDRGNEGVVRSMSTMREAAFEVRRTAQRQANGFERMREEVEGLRVVVERIAAGMRAQAEPRAEAMRALEQALEGDRAARSLVGELESIATVLGAHAVGLSHEVARYRA